MDRVYNFGKPAENRFWIKETPCPMSECKSTFTMFQSMIKHVKKKHGLGWTAVEAEAHLLRIHRE